MCYSTCYVLKTSLTKLSKFTRHTVIYESYNILSHMLTSQPQWISWPNYDSSRLGDAGRLQAMTHQARRGTQTFEQW